MSSLAGSVAKMLREELGYSSPIVELVTDEASLLKLKGQPRAELMDFLKCAGVAKVGHRLKLATLMMAQEPPAPAPAPAPAPSAVAAPQSLPPTPPPRPRAPTMAPPSPGALQPLHAAWFEVVVSIVKVRAAPSLAADVLSSRRQGAVFEADAQQGGWVRLKERLDLAREAWILVDGASLGMGPLLRPVPASARLREPVDARPRGVPRAREQDDRAIDQWLDDIH